MNFKLLANVLGDTKEVNITLPPIGSNIGIMVSGGLDSALLLYLIAKLSDGNHTICTYTVAKKDGAYDHATRIVDYVNNKLNGNIYGPIVVGDPGTYHGLQVRTGVWDTLNHFNPDVLYMGENQNPPADSGVVGLYPIRLQEHPAAPSMTPLLWLYKSHILNLYQQLNLMELLAITHTCTEQAEGRCHSCFGCKERAWGFKVAGYTDPGEM